MDIFCPKIANELETISIEGFLLYARVKVKQSSLKYNHTSIPSEQYTGKGLMTY
jgi:hypothetical protein